MKLIRLDETESGTPGLLFARGNFLCLTLERPWRDNQRNVSCIPTGNYTCKRVDSPSFGNTFQVCNVPNRDKILFHSLNLVEETQGCIGVGFEYGVLNGQFAIKKSRAAFDLFLLVLDELDEFELEILNVQQFKIR